MDLEHYISRWDHLTHIQPNLRTSMADELIRREGRFEHQLWVSPCCGDEVELEPLAGPESVTRWYACAGCGRGCDPVKVKPHVRPQRVLVMDSSTGRKE